MGKGGLSFLNKKSWHTATVANTEKVWLAEQKDASEKAKVAQLKKEIDEERQVEELRALQRQHGIGKQPVERLDWMYRSVEVEAEARQKEKEDFLLGKQVTSSAKPMSEVPVEAAPVTAAERWVDKYERRDLDAETRIREDPMLLILKQEQEQRLSIIKNPIQMRRLREEVDKKKLLKELKKAEKRERKMEKKARRGRDDEPVLASASAPRRNDVHPSRAALVPQSSVSESYGLIQPRPDLDRQHDRHRRSRSPERSRRSRTPDRSRRRPSLSPRRRRSRTPEYRHQRRSRSRSRRRSSPRHHRSRSPVGDRRPRYDSPPAAVPARSARQRNQRVRDVASSSNSRLTAEEREQRIRAMQSDAQAVHEVRSKELVIAEAEQAREEDALRLRDGDASQRAAFINELKKKAYLDSADTIEDRLQQRRHYRQKGNSDNHHFL